jgi:hypothetical protein
MCQMSAPDRNVWHVYWYHKQHGQFLMSNNKILSFSQNQTFIYTFNTWIMFTIGQNETDVSYWQVTGQIHTFLSTIS